MEKSTANLYTSRYPRGWFCLGLSRTLAIGELKSIDAFGSKLVMYRGEDGEVNVLDGYCPHMGADLGIGCVQGNHIQCAFHNWEFGGDGQCKHIPYANRIPAAARLKRWRVVEKNQLILIWHDADGGEPDYEIPVIEGAYNRDWTEWEMMEIPLEVHPREIVDNLADKAHFGPVHNSPLEKFELNLHDHIGEQVTTVHSELLGEMHFNATYYGPGIQHGIYTAVESGTQINAVMLNAHTPVDHESCLLHFGVMIDRKNTDITLDKKFMRDYLNRSVESFMMDVHIWKNKRYKENPVLCDGDGPLYKMRKWYSQFYLPRDAGGV